MDVIEGVDVRRSLEKAVELYNRYRNPEAIASIISIEGNIVVMKFAGHFCVSCGVIDWIEDFLYILKDMRVDADIANVNYFTEDNYVLVKLRIK